MNRTVYRTAGGAAFAAALLFVLSAGPVSAVHEAAFSEMDVNQDGVISRDEARGDLAERYSEADHDQDGIVDRSEFSAFEVRTEDFSNPVTGPGGLEITEDYEPEQER